MGGRAGQDLMKIAHEPIFCDSELRREMSLSGREMARETQL
jgi:hypothetical protein